MLVYTDREEERSKGKQDSTAARTPGSSRCTTHSFLCTPLYLNITQFVFVFLMPCLSYAPEGTNYISCLRVGQCIYFAINAIAIQYSVNFNLAFKLYSRPFNTIPIQFKPFPPITHYTYMQDKFSLKYRKTYTKLGL